VADGLLMAAKEMLGAHQAYLAAWNDAQLRGAKVEEIFQYLSEDLRSWFCHLGMDEPSTGDARDYINSARDAAGGYLKGAFWTSDHHFTAMRSETEGVLGCRLLLHQGDKVHPLLTLSVWRKEDGRWRLRRTYEEVASPEAYDESDLIAAQAAYDQAWVEAFRTGDAARVLPFHAPDLVVRYANRAMPEPVRWPRAEYDAGCLEAARSNPGMVYRVTDRAVAMRSSEEGLVLVRWEGHTPKGGIHPVLDLQVWRKAAGVWRLLRIYTES
jgi:hypothetical protein